MDKQIQTMMDRSGRVVIPKAIRMRLGLLPGTRLIVEEHSNEEIRLRPLPRQEALLINKGGVLVVQSQATGDIAKAVRQEREARASGLVRRSGL
jgi:AbrB family looped-hinge helix DNA binding protein